MSCSKGGERMKLNVKRIEIALARNCIDISKLSDVSGVSYKTIQRIKTGSEIRTSTAGKIASALNVDIKELLED